MSTKRVYNYTERPTAYQINVEINTLAEQHEGFSVESVTYNGAGGMSLFYSYYIEDDSWGETYDAVYSDYDDEPVATFPAAFRPQTRRTRYSSDYSWS